LLKIISLEVKFAILVQQGTHIISEWHILALCKEFGEGRGINSVLDGGHHIGCALDAQTIVVDYGNRTKMQRVNNVQCLALSFSFLV